MIKNSFNTAPDPTFLKLFTNRIKRREDKGVGRCVKNFTNVSLFSFLFLGKEHNFNKYNTHEIDYLNEVYDMDSIMHYGKTSFSINGEPTIRAIGDPDKALGQRNQFSKTDIAQLNALYDCSGNIQVENESFYT